MKSFKYFYIKNILLFTLCCVFFISCTSCKEKGDGKIYIDTFPTYTISDLEQFKNEFDINNAYDYNSYSDVGDFSYYRYYHTNDEAYVLLTDKNGNEIKVYPDNYYGNYIYQCKLYFECDDPADVFANDFLFIKGENDLAERWKQKQENIKHIDEKPKNGFIECDFIGSLVEYNDIYYHYSKNEDGSAKLEGVAYVNPLGSILRFECDDFGKYVPKDEDNILICLLEGNPDNADILTEYSPNNCRLKEFSVNGSIIKNGMDYSDVISVLGEDYKLLNPVPYDMKYWVCKWTLSDNTVIYAFFPFEEDSTSEIDKLKVGHCIAVKDHKNELNY